MISGPDQNAIRVSFSALAGGGAFLQIAKSLRQIA
jgi:hypothetical protein